MAAMAMCTTVHSSLLHFFLRIFLIQGIVTTTRKL